MFPNLSGSRSQHERHAGAAPGLSASGKPQRHFRPVIAGCEKNLHGSSRTDGASAKPLLERMYEFLGYSMY